MEIELVTTKKKLTQSLVLQMPNADLADLLLAISEPDRVLGFVVIKHSKFAIFKGVDDWNKICIDESWVAAKHTQLECVGHKRFMRFNTGDDRDLFIDRYHKLRNIAVTHIYL